MTDRAGVERGRRDLRRGSKTFWLAARLLPRESRVAGYQLYAWGRHCDDVVDGQVLGHGQRRFEPGNEEARHRFAQLEAATRLAVAGNPPDDPLYQGLAEVVRRHRIPPDLPLELLEGLASDVEGRTCPTFDQTHRYADLVGGSVAVLMAHVMGHTDPKTGAAFRRLGIAVQLTNIARDVIDDANAGRIYLPLDWLAQAGVSPTEVAQPEHRDRLASVVGRVLSAADDSYREGLAGIGTLGFRNRWVVRTGSLIYADIGRLLRRRGARAWDRRASVGRARRMVLLVKAFGQETLPASA
jgi:phytoene synthase